MRVAFCMALTLLSAGMAGAQAGRPPSKAEYARCSKERAAAQLAMALRQSGQDAAAAASALKQLSSVPADRQAGIVRAAYDVPLASQPEHAEQAIDTFSRHWYGLCVRPNGGLR